MTIKGNDILRQMRRDTSKNPKKDHAQIQVQRDALNVIHEGTIDQYREMLKKAGRDPESAEGKELINRLIALRGSESPRR